MKTGSLVLYKTKLSLVISIDDKIGIETVDGERLRVRPKDLILLHEGPLTNLHDVTNSTAEPLDLEEALALLDGQVVSFKELSELCFVNPDPVQAWQLYQALSDYFTGDLDHLVPLSAQQREERRNIAREKAHKVAQYRESLERIRKGHFQEVDHALLTEVERFALGKSEHCRILRDLAIKETQEDAHRLLLELGFWSGQRDPWPERLGLCIEPAKSYPIPIPKKLISRRDLVRLTSWAVDDSGNQDPDDAFSFDAGKLFLHIADPSEVILPDSDPDNAARSRAATLYLPWATIPMLGEEVIRRYGLGLESPSPALTLQVHIDEEGQPFLEDMFYSLIDVTRISYEEFEPRWLQGDLNILKDKLLRYQRRRLAKGAVRIQLPEVKIRCQDGRVAMIPLENNLSRSLVAEMMILAGELVADWGRDQAVPLIYAHQEATEELPQVQGLSGAWAIRRVMKRAGYSLQPKPHFGLGLESYCQCTSPLRRYLDLVNHQQIRAHLFGDKPLSYEDLQHRLAEVEPVLQDNRKCEKLSRTHFTLLWHLQNPDLRVRATVVDRDKNSVTVLVAETAFETRVNLPDPPPIESELILRFQGADLAYQRLLLTVDSSQ